MPPALSLADHLTSQQLRERMRQAQDVRLRSHYQVIYLASQGLSAPKIAQTVGYSANWVRTLVHRYNDHGKAGLVDRRQHNPGQEPLLSPEQSAQLERALEASPADGGLWNGPKVARWIAQRTRREFVYAQQGWAYLRRLGYTAQAPRRRHAEADAEAQQAFKKS